MSQQKYEAMLQRVRELRTEKHMDVVDALITVLGENDPLSYNSLCEFRRMISQQECNVLTQSRFSLPPGDLNTGITQENVKSVCDQFTREICGENVTTRVEESNNKNVHTPVKSIENQNEPPILEHSSQNDVKVRFNNLSEIIDTDNIDNERKQNETKPAEKSHRGSSILKKSPAPSIHNFSDLDEMNEMSDTKQSKIVTKSSVEVASRLCRKMEEISVLHNIAGLNESIVSKMDELRDVMQRGGSLGALQVIAEDVIALQRRAEKEMQDEHEWKEKSREQLLRDIATVGAQCTDAVTSQFIQRLHSIISRLDTAKLTRSQMMTVYNDVWEGLEKIKIILSDRNVKSKGDETVSNPNQKRNSKQATEPVPLDLVVIRTVQSLHLFLKMFPNHPDVEFVLKMKHLLRYSCEQLKDEVEIEKNTRAINLCLMAITEDQ